MKCVRIGLEQDLSFLCLNTILIQIVLFYVRYKTFPQSIVADFFHWILCSIPIIKITDNRNTQGVWCPYTKNRTGYAFSLRRVGTQKLVCLIICSLMEQINWYFIFFVYFIHTINPLVFSIIIPENQHFFKHLLYKIMKYHFELYKNFVVY